MELILLLIGRIIFADWYCAFDTDDCGILQSNGDWEIFDIVTEGKYVY